jgi:hypothetical protein
VGKARVIARRFQLCDAHVRRILRFGYLAPDIVKAYVKLTDTTAYLTTRQATTPAFTGSPVLTLRHVPFDQWQRYGSV